MSTTPQQPVEVFRYFRDIDGFWRVDFGKQMVWERVDGNWKGRPAIPAWEFSDEGCAKADGQVETTEDGTPLVPAPARGGEALTHVEPQFWRTDQPCPEHMMPTLPLPAPPPGATPPAINWLSPRTDALRAKHFNAEFPNSFEPFESLCEELEHELAASAAVAEGLREALEDLRRNAGDVPLHYLKAADKALAAPAPTPSPGLPCVI